MSTTWSRSPFRLSRLLSDFPGLTTSVDGRSSPTRVAGQRWGCAVQGSPTAFAPLLQVRTLGAECRVLAVAGVDDGGVVVASEELGLDITEQ